jgi:hypothetical protein
MKDAFQPAGGRARMCLAALAAAVGVWVAFLAAARFHQSRALEDAKKAAAGHAPYMIQMGHLGRCVSLNGPLSGGLTETCLAEAGRIAGALERDGMKEDLRVARSIVVGAIESSRWKSGGMMKAAADTRDEVNPAGFHPLPRKATLPEEPWAFLGVVAGAALTALLSWLLVLRPLSGSGRGVLGMKSIALLAAVCAVLAAVFIGCLLLA